MSKYVDNLGTEYSWDGKLEDDTPVTVAGPFGKETFPFSSLDALTNGALGKNIRAGQTK